MFGKAVDIVREELEKDKTSTSSNFIVLVFGILSVVMVTGFSFLSEEMEKNFLSVTEEIKEIKKTVGSLNEKVIDLDKFRAILKDRETRPE